LEKLVEVALVWNLLDEDDGGSYLEKLEDTAFAWKSWEDGLDANTGGRASGTEPRRGVDWGSWELNSRL
jgi:hypothetical protein